MQVRTPGFAVVGGSATSARICVSHFATAFIDSPLVSNDFRSPRSCSTIVVAPVTGGANPARPHDQRFHRPLGAFIRKRP